MFSHRETRLVKGMVARGDRQHDIASYFGVNGGRVAEVATGNCNWPNAEPMDEENLPPPGPYLTKFAVRSVIGTLKEAIDAIELVGTATDLPDLIAALELSKEILSKKIESMEDA